MSELVVLVSLTNTVSSLENFQYHWYQVTSAAASWFAPGLKRVLQLGAMVKSWQRQRIHLVTLWTHWEQATPLWRAFFMHVLITWPSTLHWTLLAVWLLPNVPWKALKESNTLPVWMPLYHKVLSCNSEYTVFMYTVCCVLILLCLIYKIWRLSVEYVMLPVYVCTDFVQHVSVADIMLPALLFAAQLISCIKWLQLFTSTK